MVEARYRSDYTSESLARCRTTCLQVAVDLGDDLLSDVVLVGGLVPTFLLDGVDPGSPRGPHPGSLDVDLALNFGLLDEDRYREVADQLRARGYEPSVNDKGRQRVQTWRHATHGAAVSIDFLIDAGRLTSDKRVQNLGADFGAFKMRGVQLAFDDFEWRVISGTNFDGATCERTIKVCGSAAYLVLKALAFRDRAAEKDAYDLSYVLPTDRAGLDEVARRLRGWATAPEVDDAIAIFAADFTQETHTGPLAAARFIGGELDLALAADLAARAQYLVSRVTENP